jgi:hypothetical protein
MGHINGRPCQYTVAFPRQRVVASTAGYVLYVLYSVLGAMDPSLSWTRTRTIITDSRGAPVSFQGYPWLIGGSARRILPALLSLPHGGTGVCLAPLLPLDACLSTVFGCGWVCARALQRVSGHLRASVCSINLIRGCRVQLSHETNVSGQRLNSRAVRRCGTSNNLATVENRLSWCVSWCVRR